MTRGWLPARLPHGRAFSSQQGFHTLQPRKQGSPKAALACTVSGARRLKAVSPLRHAANTP